MRRITGLVVVVVMTLLACGEGSEKAPASSGSFDGPIPTDAKAYPLVVSSEIVVGSNRFLVGLLNDEDAPIGSPDIAVAARFFDLEESEAEPVATAELSYLETIPGERGLYVTHVEFDSAGKWGAEVDITGDGLDETVRTSFDVKEESLTPEIGSPAPKSETPTVRTAKLPTITTDPDPDRDFYQLSIDQAVESDRPFVVVFATPKFCSSAVCGPTLDIVKRVSKDFPRLNYIHVEVYTNLDDPGNLKLVKSVKEWGLPTEPWVFVVDERGRVAAKFEGTVGSSELSDVLEKL
jgi:hypothetical protein